MWRTLLEKSSTAGALVAALACPICFPKLALLGAALGLGTFAPFERYTAFVVQALFVLAFLGQAISYRQLRNKWLLAFSAATTATLFAGYYMVRSSTLLEIALVGLLAASVWQIVEVRRCAKCATSDEGANLVPPGTKPPLRRA